MPSLKEQLAATKKDIAAADKRVVDQLGLIETMAQDGHDTRRALELLATLEQAVSLLHERRASLEEWIGRENSN